MFEKFINNEICMKIFFWLLDHSTGDYDAAIIAYDCQITDITLFTSYMYIFDELNIIDVDETSETLRVIFNEDSLIVKSFKNLRESFDDEAYRNSNVCAAFISIESGALKGVESELINGFDQLNDEEKETFIEMLKNPYDFQISDDPVLAVAQTALLEQIKELDENGQLDKFIEYINRNLYI